MKLELSLVESFDLKRCFEVNRSAWDQKVDYDVISDYYDIEGVRAGKSTLYLLDRELLGTIKGKRILHLQSYLGLDSISLSRLGAEVTAVDFCQPAVTFATDFAKSLGMDTKFICSNIYDVASLGLGRFDLIYMSYGTICWLPEIKELLAGLKSLLNPGGTFILIDFHPLAISFSLLQEEKIKYSYFNDLTRPIEIHRTGTYANIHAPLQTVEYNWNHGIGEIIDGFSGNGFTLESFKEYPFLPMDGFPNLEGREDGNYYVRNASAVYPLLFSVKAKLM